MDRRDALRRVGLGASAAGVGLGGFATEADAEDVRARVNTRSEPSQLRITDLRVVGVRRPWIVRLDTNQGLYGYGEVRDGASPTYALMLKSRILGENPCHVDKLFRKLKQFGFHGRQAGGAVAIEIVGWEIPIATDHYGHFGIEDAVKLAQALDPFNLAWLEDMVPWPYTDQYVRLKSSCKTPILTGEDIYLKDGFRDLFEKQAIAICHPDLATSGGLLETKKIGDLAMEHGIGMALHMAGLPVTLFSSVHCAAATENFLVMEHHNVDDAWYDELVTGVPKPLMDKDGFIPVPDSPGLGIELNEDAIKASLKDPAKEYFAPTPEWNEERAWDRLWSRAAPGRTSPPLA